MITKRRCLEADLTVFGTRRFWGKNLNLGSRGSLPMVDLLMECLTCFIYLEVIFEVHLQKIIEKQSNGVCDTSTGVDMVLLPLHEMHRYD